MIRSALPLAMALGLALPVATATAQAPNPLAGFEGVWRVNLARSVMGRAGPAGDPNQRAESFTWVYKAKPDGTLGWLIYHEYPLPKPSKTMTVIPDGKFRPCEMDETCLSRPGDPKEQSYAFWRMTPNMFVRVFAIKGVPSEYNVYALSPDHKTFVTTVWSPETPEFQTKMVFERQP
jgi:hypothetical protein